MNRYATLLLGLSLAMGAGAALGREANSGGHNAGHNAGHSGGHGALHNGGRAIVAVHAGPVFVNVRPAPVIVARPHFFRRSTVVIGGAVVVAAPFYPYPYPYPYYPPAYPQAYAQPPAYVEQGGQGGNVYYYCPDYRDYYPNVASCPSPWMQVLQ